MTTDRHRGLVEDLTGQGVLRDPRWREAFQDVPRHVFVPGFYADTEDGGFERVTDEGLVYRDEPLVTRLDEWGMPVSSSTMPSLMAGMLETLDLAGGERVLEIGTGTGYNAALLCHRLGGHNVVSIDIDPALVNDARGRLAGLGYHPTLAAADGAGGYPSGGPYDRIISTCSWPRVPAAWIRQVREGGTIMVNVFRGLYGGGIAVLGVRDGQASGGFMPRFGGFMPTRTMPGPGRLRAPRLHDGERRPVLIGRQILDDPSVDGFSLVAALRIDAVRIPRRSAGGVEQLWLHGRDGSWACLEHDDVVQGGPVNLWDLIEAAYQRWRAAAPHPKAALTVTADGRHLVSCGTSWELP
jgi:protein-L-isoaspartate(D-aspartate) O-methyltransferase